MFIKLVHMDSLSVEATVRRAGNGDLLLFCTCGDNREPAPENRVYMFRSFDDGKTWSKKQMIHDEDGAAHYQTCAAVLPDGEIRVFITRHEGGFLDWTNYYLFSRDNGYTWQKRDLTCLPRYAFVRDMVILNSGRIVFPYHYYPVTEEQVEACRRDDKLIVYAPVSHVETGLLISDDGGNTFIKKPAFVQTREELLSLGGLGWTWTEPTVVELELEHLVMFFRTDRSGCLWRTDSYDSGESWQKPSKTDIPNPSNKPQLIKTHGGEIVLINTPKGAESRWQIAERHPLEFWLSKDGLKSWYKKIRVSDFPGAYSYANGIVEEDGHLRLAFEFNRHDIYYLDCDLRKE